MKPILLLVSLFVSGIANATNYYFSSSTGDDTRTATQAQNPATPWKSLTKLNASFSTFSAGDSILFKRGDVFYGSITIGKAGSSGRQLNFGAYGTGSNPMITGLQTVTAWTSAGTNLWESTSAVSTLPTCMMVVINGVNTPMGRYPNLSATGYSNPSNIHITNGNGGWLNYESHVGAGQITDNELPASPNWTGATVIVKKYNWVIDHGPITSHSGKTITFTPTKSDDDGLDDMSYFIQNDIRCLDEQNEWYYNPTTKKITIYSTVNPANLVVEVANVQNLVNRNGKDYITLSNMDFRGSNDDMITLGSYGYNWIITGCNLSYAGRDAIYNHDQMHTFVFTNNTFTDINNNGVYMGQGNSNTTFNNNTLTNIGINPGMTDQNTISYNSCNAVHIEGTNNTIRYNKISHVGYNGILFQGSNVLVSNNFVEDFNSVKTDGGGIYTWGENGNGSYTNRIVEDNIIVNGSDKGVIGTALEFAELSVNGIYLDGTSYNVTVRRNYISHVNASGIYMNSPVNCTVRDNTVFDARYAQIHCNKLSGAPTLNLKVRNNICVAKQMATQPTTSYQRCFYYLADADDMLTNVSADSNIYARPIDNDGTTPPANTVTYGQTGWGKWGTMAKVTYSNYIGPGEPGIQTTYTLASWRSANSGFDQNSKKSPKTATSVYDMRFEYNATSVAKTINLGAAYMDMTGVIYANAITLQPFTAVVLIKNDATNIPPYADAGNDKTITVPMPSIPVTGGGTDYDGTIVSYSWTKISGPAAGTLTNATTATLTLSGLVQGIYKFELKVTDNKGATGKDTMTLNYGGVVVPVILADFSAQAKPNKTTYLQWKTATEINSDYFVVERSTDGRNFTQIAVVNANGNSSTTIGYSLVDNFPETGINYYRLKMVDIDGQFEYSRIVSVVFKDTKSGSIEVISTGAYASHFEVNLTSSEAQQASYAVFDAAGKVLYRSDIDLQKGMNFINNNISLPEAVYYFKITTTGEKISLPMAIRK